MRRGSAWGLVAVTLGCTLLAGLGAWQWRRGVEKQALLAAFAAVPATAASPLAFDTPVPATGRVVPVRAAGRYFADRQLLLDNQVHEGRPGYRVWTPLSLTSGGVVMVDRGWLPQHPDRRVLPDIGLDASVELAVPGLWRELPRPGLALATDACRGGGWPRIVHYPRAEDLACIYGTPVVPGLLLLDPAAPQGYVRDWQAMTVSMPPARHYAYAAQWLALSATLALGVYFYRRRN